MWKVVRRANSIKVFRGLPRPLEQMLSLYPNSTLHCVPHCRAPNINIKISPCAALPRFNAWTWGCNWVQCDPAQLLSLLHLSSVPSSHPNVLPPLQPTCTRRTSGHCLGTFITVNLALFPSLLNVVSCTTHQLSLLSRWLSLSLYVKFYYYYYYYDYYTIILI
jgi:hypothetical protein